jgi:hypothetical protein
LVGLTLALEQAAAYCERLEIPLAEYLRRFAAAPVQMLDEAVAAFRAFALVDRERIVDERDPAVATETIRLHRLPSGPTSNSDSADNTPRPMRRSSSLSPGAHGP